MVFKGPLFRETLPQLARMIVARGPRCLVEGLAPQACLFESLPKRMTNEEEHGFHDSLFVVPLHASSVLIEF